MIHSLITFLHMMWRVIVMKVIFLSIIDRSYHQTITLWYILVVLFVFKFIHLPQKGGRTRQGPIQKHSLELTSLFKGCTFKYVCPEISILHFTHLTRTTKLSSPNLWNHYGKFIGWVGLNSLLLYGMVSWNQLFFGYEAISTLEVRVLGVWHIGSQIFGLWYSI
jgi:hypothetical protein